MAFSVEMPELGESVTEGTITQWLKSVGDTVEADEPLLEVSTDKVDTEVPSPASGVLLEIKAEEDDTIDVGGVIAVIGDEGESPAADDNGGSDKNSDDSDDAAGATESAEEPAAQAEAESDESEDSQPSQGGSGAATDVAMPELGESVTEGTITHWLKSVGDEVAVDEPLLEVSTDKVDTEVPSPVAGTLTEILAEEDDTVDVSEVIARVCDGSAPAAQAAPKEEPKQEPKQEKAPESEKAPEPKQESKPEPKQDKKPAGSDEKVPYVTPLVRKLANKHGIDLSAVKGSGIGGRIRKQDVLALAGGGSEDQGAESSKPAAAPSRPEIDPDKAKLRGTVAKANRIRQITATRTVKALQVTAQLTQVHEVDMTRVAEIRAEHKEAFASQHDVKLTFLPFIVKAVAEALVEHPNVNASYDTESKEITYHADVNISIAVDTPAGLLSPVIHKAQDLSLPEIAQAIADIADRARNNKLKPNDLSGGTFTVTNIGSEGALSDTPILVPPQAGILGTGAIVKRPVVETNGGVDSIAIRQMGLLPLTYDHQVIDGADAGRFLTTVRRRLEDGDFGGELGL